ncbi:hypothetical protein DPMN_046768 [Dreissena polymorpha]|uniref:Uncharacterized protein n=1 Tax=Dreissena polymorpha TaxID=45954 RepID=A0A9D4DA82_DREPO|nr:hypothetical protein DPMN_046768 [Dreissena polymorpha]
MKILTKFHEDRTINVVSRAKNALPLGSHVFQANVTIFDLIQDIIKTNLLTCSQGFTIAIYSHIRKNASPLGSHVLQANVTIFKLIQEIIQTNLLTKFHEDWTLNVASRVLTRKTAPPPGGHVFSPIWTIFELVRDINKTNVLTKFHDDWAKIVTSRVFTRNTAPPLAAILGIKCDFYSINGTNVLTKFHKDKAINVASRVLTSQMLTAHDARRTTDDGQKAITKAHHEHIVLR